MGIKSLTILLTGSTGYIGRRLLPVLLEQGHTVICLVRDRRRFDYEDFSSLHHSQLQVVEADFTDASSLKGLTTEIDLAFYLIHSMSSKENFLVAEKKSAENFVDYLDQTNAKQIIYLGGIVNDEALSKHLNSRKNVEDILSKAKVKLTVLRAAIIIGSGSASFEIIRDLVEKLPVMIAPKWLKSRCQPIGIRNVVEYLIGVMMRQETYNRSFDIGGPDIVTYREMLMGYANVRGLKRWIIPVPVLSPQLSSHWLYFVTSTNFSLAKSLVSSLKNEVICQNEDIKEILPIRLLSYDEALRLTLDCIQQRMVVSSWKDAISNKFLDQNFLDYVKVPTHGCFIDKQSVSFSRPVSEVVDNIWAIGGDRGWYFGNWLWGFRGFIDKLVGGVGLRRGRRNATDLKAGDALDFWRVLVVDKQNGRLLLYAEMKLPGEAWLEFRALKSGEQCMVTQSATFRPLGLWGRIYWYAFLPFHGLIFPRMLRNIVRF
jgi:uncharacterized protein YbjT (DUF2867 family)